MVSVYNINGGLICSDLILRRNNHDSLSNTNNLSLCNLCYDPQIRTPKGLPYTKHFRRDEGIFVELTLFLSIGYYLSIWSCLFCEGCREVCRPHLAHCRT